MNTGPRGGPANTSSPFLEGLPTLPGPPGGTPDPYQPSRLFTCLQEDLSTPPGPLEKSPALWEDLPTPISPSGETHYPHRPTGTASRTLPPLLEGLPTPTRPPE